MLLLAAPAQRVVIDFSGIVILMNLPAMLLQ